MILIAYATALSATSATKPTPRLSYSQDVVIAQLRVERSSIIRVPPASRRREKPVKWKEKGAPPCIAWSKLAAAMVSSSNTIDLVVRGGTRYRLKLEKSCQAIDFYSGFYVTATRDGMVCEDRDYIHSRSGGQCVVDTFKTLVPSK
jgi:hypothetical protein